MAYKSNTAYYNLSFILFSLLQLKVDTDDVDINEKVDKVMNEL